MEQLEKDAAAARRTGKLDHPAIEELASAPDLPLECETYITAFRTLGSDRNPGMSGAGRIGWSMVVRYGEFYNLSKREIEEYWFIIQRMDELVLSGSQSSTPAK